MFLLSHTYMYTHAHACIKWDIRAEKIAYPIRTLVAHAWGPEFESLTPCKMLNVLTPALWGRRRQVDWWSLLEVNLAPGSVEKLCLKGIRGEWGSGTPDIFLWLLHGYTWYTCIQHIHTHTHIHTISVYISTERLRFFLCLWHTIRPHTDL